VDVLEGLTTAIIVDQHRMGADARSTVGTATDAGAMLRILFSRLGKPYVGSPQAFSFNVASVKAKGGITVQRGDGRTRAVSFTRTGGMCPRCEGRGSTSDIDLSQLYDDSRSLNEGALTIPGYTMDGWYGRIFRGCGFFDPDKPIKKFTKKERNDLLHKEATKIKVEGVNLTYEGLIPTIQKKFLSKDADALQPHVRAFVERAVTFATCRDCDGTRLSEAARSAKIRKRSIADLCAMEISDLAEWVRRLKQKSVAPLVAALQEALEAFVEIGLGYLSLDRASGTLSGGEAQRVKRSATSARRSPTSRTSSTSRRSGCIPTTSSGSTTCCWGCATMATPCWWWSTSRRRSRLPTTSSTSGPAPARPVARWCSRALSRGCGPVAPLPVAISTTAPLSRRRCGRPPARWRSVARRSTTFRT